MRIYAQRPRAANLRDRVVMGLFTRRAWGVRARVPAHQRRGDPLRHTGPSPGGTAAACDGTHARTHARMCIQCPPICRFQATARECRQEYDALTQVHHIITADYSDGQIHNDGLCRDTKIISARVAAAENIYSRCSYSQYSSGPYNYGLYSYGQI